jgi:cell filamentation protein
VKQRDRYDVSGLEEAQTQPGSRGRVLKNLLGIQSKCEMDRVDSREQFRALLDPATAVRVGGQAEVSRWT